MRFTVIVPFFNEEQHLEQCLKSLQVQSFPRSKFEILVVDNASTDRSREIVGRYPDIICLEESRRDVYVARNRGIEAATGEILVFTDADCAADRCWLERYDEALRTSPALIAVGRLSFPRPASRSVRDYEAYYSSKMELVTTVLPRECCYGHAGNMVVHASVFKQLGMFVPMPIVGDAEIIQRYLNAFPQGQVLYVDSAIVSHLEVSNAVDLLRKMYRYGKYSKDYSAVSSFRVATLPEKLQTFFYCVKKNNFGFIDKFLLLCSLVTQYAAFIAGWLFSTSPPSATSLPR